MHNQPLQQRPPGYELFFAPLQAVLDPYDYERVEFAYQASQYGHAKQRPRDDGSPYSDHPAGAAWIYISELDGRDPRVVIDALLHDLLEDSELLSPYRINLNFGMEITLDVRALTKLTKGMETTEEYLRGRVIGRGPWAILTKLCDRLHNLRTLHGCTEKKRRAQIEETRTYHLPLLIPALRACGGRWAAHADTMERLMLEAIAQYE